MAIKGKKKHLSKSHLENSDDVLWELHEGRTCDPPVDPVHEDARSDRMRNRPELRLLIRLSLRRRQLPREGRREPLPHLWGHCIRLNLRQFVILVRQSPAHTPRYMLELNHRMWYKPRHKLTQAPMIFFDHCQVFTSLVNSMFDTAWFHWKLQSYKIIMSYTTMINVVKRCCLTMSYFSW